MFEGLLNAGHCQIVLNKLICLVNTYLLPVDILISDT